MLYLRGILDHTDGQAHAADASGEFTMQARSPHQDDHLEVHRNAEATDVEAVELTSRPGKKTSLKLVHGAGDCHVRVDAISDYLTTALHLRVVDTGEHVLIRNLDNNPAHESKQATESQSAIIEVQLFERLKLAHSCALIN